MNRWPWLTKWMIGMGLVLLLLTVTPILWFKAVSIEPAEFTTEWYKNVLDLTKVCVGFVLVQVIWDKHTKNQKAAERRRAYGKWQDTVGEAAVIMRELQDCIWFGDWKGRSERIDRLSLKCEELGVLATYVLAGGLDLQDDALYAMAVEFRDHRRPELKVLLASAREGRVLQPQQEWDEATARTIRALHDYFDRVRNTGF